MRYLLIFNPHSGTKRNSQQKFVSGIVQHFKHAGHDVELYETEAKGHGYELAKQAVDTDVDVIVAIGGDGTVNEVARALVGSEKILGIIPNGSGNGLARELCISMDYVKAVNTILTHNVKRIDTCVANGEPFFVTCGIGFDGKVSENFALSETRGLPAYVKESLSVFLKYEGADFKIIVDGREITARAFLIAIANATQYGYNAFIAPGASMDDGQLDVTIIREFPQAEGPKIALHLFSKEIMENDYVRSYRGKNITLSAKRPLPYHIDGEPKKETENLKVSIVPHSLNVIVGNESNREKNIFDFFNDITNGLHYFADGVKNIFS